MTRSSTGPHYDTAARMRVHGANRSSEGTIWTQEKLDEFPIRRFTNALPRLSSGLRPEAVRSVTSRCAMFVIKQP